MAGNNTDVMLKDTEFELKISVNPKYADQLPELISEGRDSVLVAYTLILTGNNTKVHEAMYRTYGKNIPMFGFNAPKVTQLSSTYFDNDNEDLFKKFSAGLRIRSSSAEHGVVQTLKLKRDGAGAAFTHTELNVRADSKPEVPDLSLFDTSALPEAFVKAIPDLQKSGLKPMYKTDFRRMTTEMNLPVAGTFEVAVDSGSITAGKESTVISELELELKKIGPSFVLLYTGLNAGDRVCSFDFEDLKLGLVFHTLGFMKCLNRHLTENKHLEAVFGFEPFSKLKRAALLKLNGDRNALIEEMEKAADEDLPALRDRLEELDKRLRVDFSYRDYIEKLVRSGEGGPTLDDFIICGEKILDSFFDACGKVKLFGTPSSLEDLNRVLEDMININQESWYFRNAEEIDDENWGLCALFNRQSFWSGLARYFTEMICELHCNVQSVLHEQETADSEKEKKEICLNAKEFFYTTNHTLTFDLPILAHVIRYCFERYNKLKDLDRNSEEFKAIVSGTSAILSGIFSEELLDLMIEGKGDADDMQQLFRVFF